MDLHYQREATVGALVLAAIVLFVASTMWLSGRNFSSEGDVVAAFTQVDYLKRGSPVTISGVQVGRVEEVLLRGVGDVAVTMSLPPDTDLRADATATIEAVGLVGDMAVSILPGTAAEPLGTAEIPGSVRPGLSALGADLGGRAGEVLDGMARFTSPEMAEMLRQTLASTERLTAVLADTREGPTAELTRTLATLDRVLQRVDGVLADSAPQRAFARLDTLATSLDLLAGRAASTSARLDTLLLNLNRGRGTLGKFVTDTSLYEDLRATNRALQELLQSLSAEPGRINVEVKMF